MSTCIMHWTDIIGNDAFKYSTRSKNSFIHCADRKGKQWVELDKTELKTWQKPFFSQEQHFKHVLMLSHMYFRVSLLKLCYGKQLSTQKSNLQNWQLGKSQKPTLNIKSKEVNKNSRLLLIFLRLYCLSIKVL